MAATGFERGTFTVKVHAFFQYFCSHDANYSPPPIDSSTRFCVQSAISSLQENALIFHDVEKMTAAGIERETFTLKVHVAYLNFCSHDANFPPLPSDSSTAFSSSPSANSSRRKKTNFYGVGKMTPAGFERGAFTLKARVAYPSFVLATLIFPPPQ